MNSTNIIENIGNNFHLYYSPFEHDNSSPPLFFHDGYDKISKYYIIDEEKEKLFFELEWSRNRNLKIRKKLI
jgi:hypothetical protein